MSIGKLIGERGERFVLRTLHASKKTGGQKTAKIVCKTA